MLVGFLYGLFRSLVVTLFVLQSVSHKNVASSVIFQAAGTLMWYYILFFS